jgi:hypothetical protein
VLAAAVPGAARGPAWTGGGASKPLDRSLETVFRTDPQNGTPCLPLIKRHSIAHLTYHFEQRDVCFFLTCGRVAVSMFLLSMVKTRFPCPCPERSLRMIFCPSW